MGVQRPPLETLFVDMGLPSGNRWAISNLDATGPYFFQQSPFQYDCSFFSWGNVTPHNPISETAFDYNFGAANPTTPWYEGQPYGDTPGAALTSDIPLEMDAARKLLGSPWHMPLYLDYEELLANTIYIDANGEEVDVTKNDKRVMVNGVMGIYLQSKINGARLFFSCSGDGISKSWNGRGTNGYHWTKSRYSNRYSLTMFFYGSGVSPRNTNERYLGCTIRPIWNPRDLRG